MSNNAVSAYENGEKPLSQWTKGDIISEVEKISKETALSFDIAGLKKIPGPMLKDICLKQTSWHHTSEYYNRTNFYSLDVDKIVSLTDKDIKSYQEIAKEKKENAKEPTAEKWECSFLEWTGTKAHPKATTITEIGTLKGNWFIRSDGSKKSVNAKGFRKLNPVDENSELAAKPVEVKTSRPKTISKQRKPVTKKPTAEVSLSPLMKTLMKIAESLTDEERKRLNEAYRTPNFDWRNCKDIKEIYNISWNDLKILASRAEKTEPNKMSVVGQLAEIKAEQNQVKASKPLQKKQTLSIDK